MARTGRPSDYTPELALKICERMAGGESLRQICKDADMPDRRTVMRWALKRDDFRDQYAQARELLMDYWADDIIDISDDGTNDYVERETKRGGKKVLADHEHIHRSKLRVDTRKWIMSKLAPKRFGDRLIANVVGENDGPIQFTKIERVVVDPATDDPDSRQTGD